MLSRKSLRAWICDLTYRAQTQRGKGVEGDAQVQVVFVCFHYICCNTKEFMPYILLANTEHVHIRSTWSINNQGITYKSIYSACLGLVSLSLVLR
jgi:hypothetical protein